MKKIITIMLTLFTITMVNGQTPDSGNGTLSIKFNLSRTGKLVSGKFAIWVEDQKGNYINTVYLTQFKGRNTRQMEMFLPTWANKSQVKNLSQGDVDAITGPTRKGGEIVLTWNCLDKTGNKLQSGKYICKIESNAIVYSGEFEIGGENLVITPQPTYTGNDTNKEKFIDNVVITYTSNWVAIITFFALRLLQNTLYY